MTPKEKAEDLVKKFLPHAMFYIHDLTPNYKMKEEQRQNAIECALICVDEILKDEEINDHYAYWEKVKQELEKL